MIGWPYRMIVGRFDSCRHSWETIHTANVMTAGYENPTAFKFVLRCKSCGNITYRNI